MLYAAVEQMRLRKHRTNLIDFCPYSWSPIKMNALLNGALVYYIDFTKIRLIYWTIFISQSHGY